MSKKTSIVIIFYMVISLIFLSYIFALPQGASVVSGNAAISQNNSNSMQINQTTN